MRSSPHRRRSAGTSLAARLAGACIIGALSNALSSAPARAQSDPLDRWPANVLGHTARIYYDIHGRTLAELHAEMARLGPKIAGSSFVGETRSPMHWQWRTEATGGSGCLMRDVKVSITSQVTLPRWTPPPDTEPGVLAAWNKFIAGLELHEAGHKDISAKAGTEIISRVGDLAGLCSDISRRASDIANRIVERANEAQRTYDDSTRHGATQGTSFGRATGAGAANGATPAGFAVPGGTIVLLNDFASLKLLADPRPGTARGPVAAPLDKVWSALADAFGDIGFTVNVSDSVAHAAGDSLTATGPVRRLAISEIVSCRTPLGSVDADSVPVTLFLVARLVRESDTTTTVTTILQAVYRRTSGEPLGCISLGVVEKRLLAAIRGRVE